VAFTTGCGGSGVSGGGSPARSAYEAKLEQARRVLLGAVNATIVISSQPKSPSGIRSEARRARAVLRTTAVELANAQPPSDARRDNDKIVAGLRFMDDQVAQYAKAAAARDWKAINQLDRGTMRWPIFDAALGALEDLRKKGYKVGALSSTSKEVRFGSCSGGTVTAPTVIGQPEPEAVRHLREAGLDVTVFPQIKPNRRVPAGVVVHESPRNFPVCKGTSIWIIVSIGKT
jgi:hypothetical protein